MIACYNRERLSKLFGGNVLSIKFYLSIEFNCKIRRVLTHVQKELCVDQTKMC